MEMVEPALRLSRAGGRAGFIEPSMGGLISPIPSVMGEETFPSLRLYSCFGFCSVARRQQQQQKQHTIVIQVKAWP